MMRRILKLIFLILFFVNFSLLALAGDPHVAKLETSPVPEFSPPDIKMISLPNGLKIYFLPNTELPILELSALIPVGTMDDPSAQSGLASFMAHGLRSGGTKNVNADEMDKILDQMASEIDIEVGKEFSMMDLKTLVSNTGRTLELFFDMLRNPAFDADKMNVLRDKMLNDIRRRNEEPQGVAKRKFNEELYGHESFWARAPTLKSVQSLSRENLMDFHRNKISPDKILLAVSGNISFEEFLKKIKNLTKDWSPHPVLVRNVPLVEKKWDPRAQVLDMPVNQSALAVGHFGDKRFNPDKYALVLINQIMGQATIGSRLGARIRTELGLAYSVFSNFGLETDYGAFEVTVGTKTASTLQVVEEIKKVLKEMQTDKPITEEELVTAKKTILNQLVFQYEEPFKIVTSRVIYDYYGYPADYLSIYQREIKKVSLAQIQEAMQKYYFPDRLKILIVGNKKEMGDLSKLGKVESLEMGED